MINKKRLKNTPCPINKKHHCYSRGYLPHFDHPEKLQSLTFRLHDAMPSKVVVTWKAELAITKEMDQNNPACVELRRRIAKYEDCGYGACWLKDREVARIVQDALLFFDGERYRMISWCIMPNHVHALIERLPGFSLSSILHSWKSFTAVKINKLLSRSGEFWEREEHDRFIRSELHLGNVVRYIEFNPVVAGLVSVASDWEFSSAARCDGD